MLKANFINDNTEIIIPDPKIIEQFSSRVNNEHMFRRIISFLISNNIIKNNIIDSGAWIGENTLPWAKKLTNSLVYAIEPSINNCDFIECLAISNDIDNIRTIAIALSDVEEILSTNDHINDCELNNNDDGILKVMSIPLDKLYSTNKIDNIGFIHVDVEGMEFKVLKGCKNIINEFRPIIAFEQYLHSNDYNDVINYLKKMNYCVTMINEVLASRKKDCRNFIAYPHENVNMKFFRNIDNHLKEYYPEYNDVFLRFF